MNRDLILIGVAVFTWGLGEGMFLIFQPLYLQQWGASPVQIGAILGAVGIAQAAMQIPSGHLSDRIGPRSILWTAWIIGTLATIFMAWSGSLPVFIAGMILYGTTMFVNPALSSFYIRVRGKLSVERVFTIMSAAFNLGVMIGPLIGGFIGERTSLQTVYRVSVFIFLISTAFIFTLRKPAAEPEHHEAASANNGSLLRNTRYMQFLGLVFFALFAMYLAQPLTPNFLQNERGFTLESIGQLGSLAALTNVILLLLLGGMQARAGILIGQGLMAIYALLLWHGTSPISAALAYCATSGFRLARQLTMAYGRSLIHPSQTGLAFGLLETSAALTVVTAPLVAGFLYQREPVSVYPTSLVLIAVSFLTALFFFYGRKSQPSKTAAGENP